MTELAIRSHINQDMGKLPPQAIDMEEAVLGALMLERDALYEVVNVLKPESFYKDAHKDIYQAIISLFEKSEPVDMRTVANQLRETGKLDSTGGAYYIADLTSKVSSAANIEYHARIVAEMHIKRELIHMSSQVRNMSYDDTEDAFQVIEYLEMQLSSLVEKNVSGELMRLSESINKSVSTITNMKNLDVTGVSSGLHDLDRITNGFQNSELVIIAARPGMGKTAFVVTCMLNAVKQGKVVAMFSLEMSRFQLDQRIISSESFVELSKIKKPKEATPEELMKIREVKSRVANYEMYIDDTPSIGLIDLKAKCRRLQANQGLDMVVVDYLQLMSDKSSKNREQQIANISRGLKEIAKEFDVPVIALSQLSRAVEQRGGDKKPLLSDLRESGSIEQDADLVAFLYRPEYYGITSAENGESLFGKGMVIVAKNRQGALDEAFLKFLGRYTKWDNEEEIHELNF